MALTDTTVWLVRPTGKNFALKDADGLALIVSAKGARNWHFRFYRNGQQVRISLGTYPEISLKEARELRDEARALVAKGIDPAHSLKTGRQSTLSQLDRIFKKDVLPSLGQRATAGGVIEYLRRTPNNMPLAD